MATYVTSDAHGHLRALDRALELAAPGANDTLYVLGDMVDRGPDPVGVIKLVRSLGAHVLMGNHERMLLDTIASHDDADELIWALNGGASTLKGLDDLPREAAGELVAWIRALPLYDVVEAGDRLWILVHAGIDALDARGYLATAGVPCTETAGAAAATREQLLDMMAHQDPEELLWTRERFWGAPTGLVGTDGRGPVVVAGHTPSILLAGFADEMEGVGATDEGQGMVVRVGASPATGGVADRIDIDCAAAAGAGAGRVGVMRLEDGATWYAAIEPGE